MKLGVKCSAYDLIGAAPDGHVLVQVHTEAVLTHLSIYTGSVRLNRHVLFRYQ